MNLRLSAARIGLLLVAIAFVAGESRADYIVNGGDFLGTHRIRDDGTVVASFFPPPETAGLYETTGEDAVVTPDLKTLYQFTNSLGVSNLVFLYDIPSNAYSTYHELTADGAVSLEEFLIYNARMSLVRPIDPLGAGDLFTISGSFPFMDGLTPQIKRFSRAINVYVETIDPPTPQTIQDFGFGPDNQLYMAAENGIFVYQESAAGFDLVSPTPLLGSLTGKLTFGPDGRMYLVNAGTGNIERYTTAGAFVDTFVPAVGGGSSIQFGVDGNLHALVGSSTIKKFDGATGTLLATTNFAGNDPFVQFGAFGRITYLPVPEPNSLLLAAIGAALAVTRRRRHPSQH